MALNIQGVERSFKCKINGKEQTLQDPNPAFSPDEVMLFYANTYPELTTATVAGPIMNENGADYEFKTTVGTKG